MRALASYCGRRGTSRPSMAPAARRGRLETRAWQRRSRSPSGTLRSRAIRWRRLPLFAALVVEREAALRTGSGATPTEPCRPQRRWCRETCRWLAEQRLHDTLGTRRERANDGREIRVRTRGAARTLLIAVSGVEDGERPAFENGGLLRYLPLDDSFSFPPQDSCPAAIFFGGASRRPDPRGRGCARRRSKAADLPEAATVDADRLRKREFFIVEPTPQRHVGHAAVAAAHLRRIEIDRVGVHRQPRQDRGPIGVGGHARRSSSSLTCANDIGRASRPMSYDTKGRFVYYVASRHCRADVTLALPLPLEQSRRLVTKHVDLLVSPVGIEPTTT